MGGFAELSYTPYPDWTFAFLYKRIATLQQGSTDYSHATGDFWSYDFLVRYYVAISSRAGVALQAEFSQSATTAQGCPPGSVRRWVPRSSSASTSPTERTHDDNAPSPDRGLPPWPRRP